MHPSTRQTVLRGLLTLLLLCLALPAAAQSPAAGVPAVDPRESTPTTAQDRVPGAGLVVGEDLVVEEELTAPAAGLGAGSSSTSLDQGAIASLFTEAEAVFLQGDQPTALLRFGQLIDLFEIWLADAEAERLAALEAASAATPGEDLNTTDMSEDPGAASTEDPADEDGMDAPIEPPMPTPELLHLSPAMQALFVRTLAYRAELYHAFGDREQAETTLERMLGIDPGADLDRERAPADLVKSFSSLRKKKVGEILLVPEPPDLVARLGGRLVESFEKPVAVLAGEPWIEAQRPGYSSVAQPLPVRAGREETVELVLERTSPVIRLHSRPAGAQVLLNGRPVGVTSGIAPEGFLPQAASVRYRSAEFSEELVIDNIEPGLQVLEVQHPGYRPYREELLVDELLDYPMPPVVLEEERGFIVFRNFPPNAELRIDDQRHPLDDPGAARPRVTLPPNAYRVTVTSGRSRMFSTDLRLADRQTIEVNVQLRPGLTFLGTLGGDAAAGRDLVAALSQVLRRSEQWAFLDRAAEGTALLRAAGLEDPRPAIDWATLQAHVDRETPGLLYLAAVLDGTEIRFLLWPAAPGPPQADELRLPRGDARALDRLLEALEPELLFHRPWLGAVLINSAAAPHPVVAAVTAGSSAEAVGLQPGEQLVAVAGTPVFSRADVLRQLQTTGEGTLDLGVQGRAGARRLELQLRPGPAVLRPARDGVLPAVAWATLGLLEETADASRKWLVQLSSAMLLMDARDWPAATAILRRVDAPQSSHGFGQAAVDYWLGLTLERGGDFEGARAAYTLAMRLPGARLFHHDGPYLAPRARARLAALGGS